MPTITFSGTIQDFYSIRCNNLEAVMLHNLYKKINELNLWEKFCELPEELSFMSENIFWINDLYIEVNDDSHSALTYSICLQQMKYIATYGIEKYIIKYTIQK